MNYIHGWLYRTCPTCERNNRSEIRRSGDPPLTFHTWCVHHRPAMQLRGDRGITLSFDKVSPSLRILGFTEKQLHSGLRSIAEAAYNLDMGRTENLFLELDVAQARVAAGYGRSDSSDSEEDEFLDRRHNARNNFPLRDIHCMFEITEASRIRAENETRLRRRTLPNFRRYIENGDIDAEVVRNDCRNCGNHVMVLAHAMSSTPINGNYQTRCTTCSGDMCLDCSSKGVDFFKPICYPCQFHWQISWLIPTSRSSASSSTTLRK